MGPIDKMKALWHLNKLANLWEKTFWRTNQMGWKTIGGAVIAAIAMVLYFLETAGVCQGCEKMGDGVLALGAALGFVGLRHAVAKLMAALPKGGK